MEDDGVDLPQRLQLVMRDGGAFEAIEFEGRSHTWSEIAVFTGRLAGLLETAGCAPEGAVAVVLRNRPTGVAALISVLATRRCAVLINPIQPVRALCMDIGRLRPAVIVADAADWTEELESAARDIGAAGIRIFGETGFDVSAVAGLERIGLGPRYEAPPGAAVVVPTSGTTGPPKRIPLSWARLASQVPEESRPLRQGRGVIVANPLVTITGLNLLLAAVARPLLLVLMERLDVRRWADLVERHKPKTGGLPPAGMRMLLDAEVPREKLASLESWVTGSAPLDATLADLFEETYAIPVLSNYGATEFGGAVTRWSVEEHRIFGKAKRGSSGRPVNGFQLRVVGPKSGEPMPPGEQGLLEVHIPANHTAGPEGWTRTTDLARVDQDGFLFLDGRCDDVIIRGGFKVPLAELEAALKEHSGVSDAAAVGLDDERLGQVPAAMVVPARAEAPPTEADLVVWVRERLPPYMTPVRILVSDALPLNPSLKVSRPRLRELLTDPGPEA